MVESKDQIPEPNTHISYSISTTPREFESYFEVEPSSSNTQPFTYEPGEYKSKTNGELHIIKSIYYENVISLDRTSKGIIEICIRASSYIISPASSKQSASSCFNLEIIDQDTMPPLFCSNEIILSGMTHI